MALAETCVPEPRMSPEKDADPPAPPSVPLEVTAPNADAPCWVDEVLPPAPSVPQIAVLRESGSNVIEGAMPSVGSRSTREKLRPIVLVALLCAHAAPAANSAAAATAAWMESDPCMDGSS